LFTTHRFTSNMCGSILSLHLPLSFMLLRTRSCPFILLSGFFQKRSKMPSRVQASCDRSRDAASTALEAKDWYSVSGSVVDCGCPSSTGSGTDAEIFAGSPDDFACCMVGDSRPVGVASFVDECESFCFLGAGAALGGRPGPRFSPIISAIFVTVSSIRSFHIVFVESNRGMVVFLDGIEHVTIGGLAELFARLPPEPEVHRGPAYHTRLYGYPTFARPYQIRLDFLGLPFTNTNPEHSPTTIHRHALHARHPRAPPSSLFRCTPNQDSRILPDLCTIVLVTHMRLADPIPLICSSKAQHQACEPCDKAREHTAGPRNESAQFGQETM
jgi:hypothetical protein